LEDHGPDEALRILELDEIARRVPTVSEWLHNHINNLTGVQPATLARYRTYVTRDIDSVFGSLPVSAVTETTIARWIKLGSGGALASFARASGALVRAAARMGTR
jgi:integrase